MKKGKKTALIVLAILVAVCGIVTYNMVKGYEKAKRSTRNSKKAYQQSREDNDSRFGYGYYVNNHVNPYSMGEIATRSAAIDNEDQLRSRSMASERKEEEAAVRMAVSIAISGIICIAFIVTIIGFIKSRLGEGRTVKDAAITAGKQAAKALSRILK